MKSRIKQSDIDNLRRKVQAQDYGKFLKAMRISQLRGLSDVAISFDFPVTALIGPNGSGKSTILGAAACAYKSMRPSFFFPKSNLGDDSMSGWRVEFDLIEKDASRTRLVQRSSHFRNLRWVRGNPFGREVLFFGIDRAVPAGEKPKYKPLRTSRYVHNAPIRPLDERLAAQIERVLGKPIGEYRGTEFSGDSFFLGENRGSRFSEFHFGAGESSVIRMIAGIEAAPSNSLILVEEIENGLHPVATRRMVEYLIDVASRNSIQAIFTTHSDFATDPLPADAIWACLDNRLKQGRLSVESLRAVTGSVENALAVFVEDVFSKTWVESILRAGLGPEFERIEVHAVGGDVEAIKHHRHHRANPAIKSRSLCYVDGDSDQDDDNDGGVYRLPGGMPERTVFEDVAGNLNGNIASLSIACQVGIAFQQRVRDAIELARRTCRDDHLLFAIVGKELAFLPESVVRGAFIAEWIGENPESCEAIVQAAKNALAELDSEMNA